jgi:hypothetical protein
MDTASVEQAFSTDPSVNCIFTGSPGDNEMTFTPTNPGFPPQTMVTVRIADTARAATSGRTFYASFESRYRCGNLPPKSP